VRIQAIVPAQQAERLVNRSALAGRCPVHGSQLFSDAIPRRSTRRAETVAAPMRTGVAQRVGVSLVEVVAIWLLVAVLTLGVLITYSLVSTADLYHVSKDGLTGGLGRTLVHLNYPVAFIAIALVAFAWARLVSVPEALAPVARRLVGGLTLLAIGFCLVAAAPGVVEQSDLDAKPINVVPALGVLLAVTVTVIVVRAAGLGVPAVSTPASNWIALGFASVLVFFSLPLILAEFGVYIGDVPLLGRIFMSKDIPTGHELRAVHLGHHHGLDGTVFALAALALLRPFGQLATGWLRGVLAAVVALLLVYGVANAFQDFWGEQIEKRGWASFEILPNVTRPELNLAWGVMLVAIIVVTTVLVRRPAVQSVSVSG
jgi:hypothetical protein